MAQSQSACDINLKDPRCRATDGDLISLSQRKDLTILEINFAPQFLDFHLLGAQKTTPQAAKTKSYLFNNPVLLVGRPLTESSLRSLCGQMYNAGFKNVKILEGGSPRWKAVGGKFQGDEKNLLPPYVVRAEDLLSAELSQPTFIGLDTEKNSALFNFNWKKMPLSDSFSNLSPPAVFVSKDGDAITLDELRKKVLPKESYYIEGGLAALQQAVVTFEHAKQELNTDNASCK